MKPSNPRRVRAVRGFALSALLTLSLGPIGAAPLGAASHAPDLRFHTLSTARLDVHFHQGLEGQARHAAALAEEIIASLEARYGVRLPRVQVVISDESDGVNGFSSIFPYPLIRLTAAGGDGTDVFGPYADWMRYVLTHEIAHLIHFERVRGLGVLGRHVMGRAPFLFPNAATPPWMVEGLATLEETRGTAFGRGRNPDSRMVLRMAAIEGRFPREDQATGGLDRWPAGHAPYLFGEAFLRDLSTRFGADVAPRLARTHPVMPLPYLDEITSNVVTGAPFARRWAEWKAAAVARFEAEANHLRWLGLSASHPLTRRGLSQTGARFSPDGAWIAYSSSALTRRRAIRIMRPDGADDRAVTERNGNLGLAWTPDGRSLVFGQPDYYRRDRWWSDLHLVDLASGRTRQLTHGARASDPDVTPDGRVIVFVRRTALGSQLAAVTIDGSPLPDLTHSAPRTMWSGPRVSPDGDLLVASRLLPGGYMDLVLLDLANGTTVELTHDRAEDSRPCWSADGDTILFESDRDGISNIYALRLRDGAVLRVTRVLGGAFSPALDPADRSLVFSRYASIGDDLHVMPVDLAALEPATPFEDPYPPSRPSPPPAAEAIGPYRPWRTLAPRYWMPFLGGTSDALRLGVTTSGHDALFRHLYSLTGYRVRSLGRFGFDGSYVYDRYHPTLFLAASDSSDPVEGGTLRQRNFSLGASFTLTKNARREQSLGLTWRVERRDGDGDDELPLTTLSGVAATWTLGSARTYPFTISPVEGGQLKASVALETPWLGSDAQILKLSASGLRYVRLGETHVLALRAGGATAIGEGALDEVFTVGGFASGSLFDLSGIRSGLVRGYEDDVRFGRHVLYANAEYRFPLLHPQRGLWSVPAFVRHVHGALFVDLAHAWTGPLVLRDAPIAAGAAIGIDAFVGHALPITGTAGVARGLGEDGSTRAYVRLGLAF